MLCQSIDTGARIDDVQVVESQVFQGDAHGWGQSRGILALELNADATPVLEQEQVQFGAAVCAPEVSFVWRHRVHCFFEGIALPRSAQLRVQEKIALRASVQEMMQDAAVTEENLR